MRYKCVIPMIVDQEAKEREKRQKEGGNEKEEGGSTVKNEDEYVNEAEINESKNRVHEHFKQMSQTNKQVDIPSKKKKKGKKKKQLTLSQMHGGKRKREFDIGNDYREKNDNNDFSMMPTPYLDAGTVHVSKKAKQKAQEAIEEQKMQENLTQVQSDNKTETVKSIR